MANFNRVLLMGNLTKDPELRYTPSGTAVTNLRLAVNSQFKSQSGERKEETCFVTVVVWARQAETCQQYLKKGRSVFVEGRLISRSWEFEGKTRSTMEVRADRVQFLGGPRGEAAAEPPAEGRSAEPVAESVPEGGTAPEGGQGTEDDVPF